jgi:hypothetical protein
MSQCHNTITCFKLSPSSGPIFVKTFDFSLDASVSKAQVGAAAALRLRIIPCTFCADYGRRRLGKFKDELQYAINQ